MFKCSIGDNKARIERFERSLQKETGKPSEDSSTEVEKVPGSATFWVKEPVLTENTKFLYVKSRNQLVQA